MVNILKTDEFRENRDIRKEIIMTDGVKRNDFKEGIELLTLQPKICENGEKEMGGDGSVKVERKCWQRFLGMALMIIASICFSLAMAIVKLLDGYDVFSIGVWRFLGGCLIPSVFVVIYFQFIAKTQPFQTLLPLCNLKKFKTFCVLNVRAGTGSGAILLQYNAIKYISISDSTVISFSAPVFVTFLACLLLGESFGVMNILAALVTLIGVGIITRPTFLTGASEMDSDVLFGVGLCLASMTLATFMFLSLRMLSSVNFAAINLYFGLIGTTFCYVLSESFGSFEIPRSSEDWFLAFLLTFFTFGGLVAQTMAFKYEDAGPLSLCRSFDVIFSFVWQAILLSVTPDKYSVIGSLVVLSGVIFVGFRKHVSSLPEDHQCRKTCCCVLK